MITSTTGIQLGDTRNESEHFYDVLVQNLPAKTAEELFNPDDKQNVPKAVNLLQTLKDFEGRSITITPGMQKRVERIIFLAALHQSGYVPLRTGFQSLNIFPFNHGSLLATSNELPYECTLCGFPGNRQEHLIHSCPAPAH
jgi:hypothetical protein